LCRREEVELKEALEDAEREQEEADKAIEDAARENAEADAAAAAAQIAQEAALLAQQEALRELEEAKEAEEVAKREVAEAEEVSHFWALSGGLFVGFHSRIRAPQILVVARIYHVIDCNLSCIGRAVYTCVPMSADISVVLFLDCRQFCMDKTYGSARWRVCPLARHTCTVAPFGGKGLLCVGWLRG